MKKLFLIIFVLLTACSVIRPSIEKKSTINLPIVYNHYPKVALGAYLEVIRANEPRLQWAKPNGIIGTGINFSVINWEQLDMVYTQLEEQNLRYTIQIKFVPPTWRVYPEKECSPPKPEYYDDFARLVIEVLDRYDPYLISIWNEPEPTPKELPPGWDHYIGCWGDLEKEYFGGEDYGKFLAYIYPIIKNAHPDITIAGGELVFSLYNERDKQFAKGLVKYGMFDEFAFHSYPSWPYPSYDYPFMQAEFARTLTDKPLQLSETSYACDDAYYDCSDPAFLEAQAKYLEHILDGALAERIVLIRWYTLANNGWRNTDLVYRNIPKPAYYIYLEH